MEPFPTSPPVSLHSQRLGIPQTPEPVKFAALGKSTVASAHSPSGGRLQCWGGCACSFCGVALSAARSGCGIPCRRGLTVLSHPPPAPLRPGVPLFEQTQPPYPVTHPLRIQISRAAGGGGTAREPSPHPPGFDNLHSTTCCCQPQVAIQQPAYGDFCNATRTPPPGFRPLI